MTFRLFGGLLLLGISHSEITRAAADEVDGSCALHPVLIENFDSLSVAPRTIGPARWTAHTPWSGDFGDARFVDPGPVGPFKVVDGILSITASKDAGASWISGLIAAADASGAGSGTRFGYFEARMKLPKGPGTWPAFWLAELKPVDAPGPSVEIDVLEYYGQFTSAYRANIHVWYKGADAGKTSGIDRKVDVQDETLTSEFHTYGVDLSPQAIVFFLDGRKVWSQPPPSEMTHSMYPIVNLALGSGWPIAKTPNPSTLLVKYVHVFGRGAGPPAGCLPGLRED